MSALRLNWGMKIAVLYGGFVALIMTLVIASSKQNVDLVANDYYEQELAYQDVINASKNQATLSKPLSIHADEQVLTIDFPKEHAVNEIKGSIHFYSPINEKWDKKVDIDTKTGSVVVARAELMNTRYKVKVNWKADSKDYYQESEITLY